MSNLRLPRASARTPRLQILPFRAGHRPGDAVYGPGHGCSEHVGYVFSAPADDHADEIWILLRLQRLAELGPQAGARLEVRMSAWLLADGGADERLLPGFADAVVTPRALRRGDEAAEGAPRLRPAQWSERGALAITIPAQALLAAAGSDAFSFAHAFHRRIRIELTLHVDGAARASDATEVELFDQSRLGSLYRRLLERLLPADVAAQSQACGTALACEHHPWFPVLSIGTEKARLYLEAIAQDLRGQRRHLPDPRWLLRVGLYLELLTCLGIFEAVGDTYPDLLSAAERQALQTSPALAAVRQRLDVEAWRKVWALRGVRTGRTGGLSRGPVSLLNLLRKKSATLAFLHAHHGDLRGAIELSGQNLGDAQETWHRVLRDAERAVFRQHERAFPELLQLPASVRAWLLWRQAGELPLGGRRVRGLFPAWLARKLGDQDGLFASAARQYRDSMNEVAEWARDRGLLDYTGRECVPIEASLLEARLVQDEQRLLQLQRRDGYLDDDLGAAVPSLARSPLLARSGVARALARSHALGELPPRVLALLAQRARPVYCGPLDRIVQQGQPGASLFVVAEGHVEVLSRRGGEDALVSRLSPGAVFGEYALLTGAARSATVRACEESVVYELRREALAPLLASSPLLASALGRLVVARQPATERAAA
ncbi:MAG: cyclic nucleotide-binding domain-containing protein [Polyangia bacterium]